MGLRIRKIVSKLQPSSVKYPRHKRISLSTHKISAQLPLHTPSTNIQAKRLTFLITLESATSHSTPGHQVASQWSTFQAFSRTARNLIHLISLPNSPCFPFPPLPLPLSQIARKVVKQCELTFQCFVGKK